MLTNHLVETVWVSQVLFGCTQERAISKALLYVGRFNHQNQQQQAGHDKLPHTAFMNIAIAGVSLSKLNF